jgi:hypothetical protein
VIFHSYVSLPEGRTQRTQTSSSRILCYVLFLWVAVDSSNQFVEFLGCKWLQQKVKKSTNQQEHLNIKHSSESSRALAESRYSVSKILGNLSIYLFFVSPCIPQIPQISHKHSTLSRHPKHPEIPRCWLQSEQFATATDPKCQFVWWIARPSLDVNKVQIMEII